MITTRAGEVGAEDELDGALGAVLCDPPPGEEADEEAEDPFPTGATAVVFDELPPPPHAAVKPATAAATASFCSLRIIASRARSYNWLVPMAPQPAGEPLGFP
ncbi:hypothetical protein [Catenulispora acidiphila]|uniref:hypothetical protein n=1 Tax=Catenulispora acidiphila TaxID=304895 RepID=UPI001CC094D1|nr:hypothetical protein [Catenulispora acidiphila]